MSIVSDLYDEVSIIQAERDALAADNQRLREALEKIAAIEDEQYGGDWDEIEEARTIASAALAASK